MNYEIHNKIGENSYEKKRETIIFFPCLVDYRIVGLHIFRMKLQRFKLSGLKADVHAQSSIIAEVERDSTECDICEIWEKEFILN